MKFHITLRSFSLADTTFLKGVAILLIVLHNFYRWVNPITGENEFWFNTAFISRSWIFLRNDPLELFHVFFNFLGHYGVQAFIVISAYGLTISYNRSQPGYGRFVLHRFDKLYPSLILAGIGFILFSLMTHGELIAKHSLTDLMIQFTLFANLVPGKAMVISGPWWFYSFIFQFYLVFPLLYRIHRKTGWAGLAGLTLLSYIAMILLYTPMTSVDLNPYMTLVGHLPEFCLGIFLASRKEVSIPWWVLLAALAVLIGGNIYRWLWPFANLGAAVLLIVSIRSLTGPTVRMKTLYAVVSFIGVISMYLFAVHGYMRSPFLDAANHLGNPVTSLLIAILFLVVVCGVSFLLMATESSARRWIASGVRKRSSLARFGLLFILVTGGFALLFSMKFSQESDRQVSTQEVIRADVSHGFEEPIPGRWDKLTDSIAYKGNGSVVLEGAGTFSPGFRADLDTLNLEGLPEVDLSAWLRCNDPQAYLHLVMEIWDRPTNRQVEWQSEFIRSGSFEPGKWFQRTFTHRLRPEFRKGDYQIKLYAWNPSRGTWYIDELRFQLKEMRKPVK